MLNSKIINMAMQRLGLSQARLAEMCNVSRESVSNWLSGESIPRPNKLKSLSAALDLPIEELWSDEATLLPVVAYRTRKNRPVTGRSMQAALDLASKLVELVPFVRKNTLFDPPVLQNPSLDDAYIREVTKQLRDKIGLSPKAPICREHLLQLHHDFGSILVPVLWGANKDGHENALSVYLPDSKISWVVFSLNAHDDDFNYWLAHELGHCYTLHSMQGDVGEKFAERFAQELLFPFEVAVDALESIKANSCPKEHASWYAGTYSTSIVTVIRQSDRVAKLHNLENTGIESKQFWADWSAGRNFEPTVLEVLFGENKMSTEEYILKCEDEFKTPIFRALAQWQINEGGRSPAFISEALNVDIGQAIDLSHALWRLHGSSA